MLTVEDLHVDFPTRQGTVHALNGASFNVSRNEILGLVGETGSGKSVTAATIIGLLRPPGHVTAGRIRFEGQSLIGMPDPEMNRLRGGQIALIVQNAKAALNPMIPVGRQIVRVYMTHLKDGSRRAEARMLEMLEAVGFSDPRRVASSFPHQLSGGMAQRVVIAIALGTSPKFVIADEPTTGLDASIQSDVLDLMVKMIADVGASALLITHDLGIVANYCHAVAVMHAGQVVEYARSSDFFRGPLHPYGRGLLNALTDSNPAADSILVMGNVPDLTNLPSGCAYRLRCPLAVQLCSDQDPAMKEIRHEHWSKCHRADELEKAR